MAVARRSSKAKSAEVPLEEVVTAGRRKRTPAGNPLREEDFSSPGAGSEETRPGSLDSADDSWTAGGEDNPEDRSGGRIVVRARTKRTVSPRDSRERENRVRQGSGDTYDNGNGNSASYGEYSRSPGGARQTAQMDLPPEGNPGFPLPKGRSPVPQEAPVLPKNLPPMPDIYGKPEPRGDQDNGKPRLCINELIRLNMMDLRDLAACYNISHEDMVNMKKQEIIFSLLKAHTERGG
ncbi:MAG: Rho termination factor N-terminal domain-containing protein, partial [Treponema sp.]|nr:Rho termination factor N-terminal domain-containing protein [Treponema sp.]